jgi:two-component system response regulator ResD
MTRVLIGEDGSGDLRLPGSERGDAVIVLRRYPSLVGMRPPDITTGDLTVSMAARSVTVKGAQVRLTRREFDLLLFFVTHPDTVFSREELLKHVWHWDFGDLSTVTVHVKRLRSKLGDQHRVQTVWGHGYLWSRAAD